MESVYIETTIPSFYFETRKHPTIVAWHLSTRRWWDVQRAAYRTLTSGYVIDELRVTPGAKAGKMLAMMEDVACPPAPNGIDEVISVYLEHRLMPQDARGDAAHLAFASMVGADYLLTWNCRHLANANKARQIGVLNERLGLRTPILATPDTLFALNG
ncbi:MAG: hypothetical protein JNM86_08605 [Phycisphaerae bacterium]|nr:hypothetical protein [Phycisphaerae bacterium]